MRADQAARRNNRFTKRGSELETRLLPYAGKPVGVIIRTAGEMKAILDGNPFPKQPRNFAVAIFLDERPPSDALDHALGKAEEERNGNKGSMAFCVHAQIV